MKTKTFSFSRKISEKKIFTFLIFLLGCVVFLDAWRAFADSSFSSSGFTINLNDLDPIKNNTNVSPTGTSGLGAFKTIIRFMAEFLLYSIPVLAWVALIIAGYFFIFSGGDSDKVTKGKNIIKFNLIAIIVAFMSWSIISLIARFFA